jgi:hypothetical protein
MKSLLVSILLGLSSVASADYLCTSQSGKTTLTVTGSDFSIVQGSRVLRYGKLVNQGCQESYPATCVLRSAKGEVGVFSIGETATGHVLYRKDGRDYETPMTCSLHPYSN